LNKWFFCYEWVWFVGGSGGAAGWAGKKEINIYIDNFINN